MTANRIAFSALISAFCVCVLPPADAARPLVTDDAGVLEAGECEIETFIERSRVRGEPAYLGGSVQPGCGIGLRTQLSLIGARFDGDPAATQAGFAGDGKASPWLAFGARYRAIDNRLSINGSIAVKSGGERQTLATIGARLAF